MVREVNRAFRALWFGTGAANLGDGITLVGLPLIAVTAGLPPSSVAAVTVVGTLAWPVLGLPAGWVVDRFDRRTILVCANAARALVLALATLTAVTGAVTAPLLLAVSAAYGVAETLVDTALTSAVPSLVAAPDRTRANARIEGTINLTNQLAGPPLAGLLVAVGSCVALGAGAGLYVTALVAVALIGPLPGHRQDIPVRRGADRRVRAGLIALWRHPVLRALTVVTAAMNLVWATFVSLFVVHAVAPGPLGLDPAAYGLLLTAMALGGLLATVVVDPLRRVFGARRLLLADCVGTVLLVAPTALGWGVWPIAVGVVLAGAGSSVWRVLVATIRQHVVRPDLLGRVYAASRVISWGSVPLGAALAGALATLTSVRWTFGIATGLAIVVVAGYLLVAARHDLESAFVATAADHASDAA